MDRDLTGDRGIVVRDRVLDRAVVDRDRVLDSGVVGAEAALQGGRRTLDLVHGVDDVIDLSGDDLGVLVGGLNLGAVDAGFVLLAGLGQELQRLEGRDRY
ncbi:MAG TPA: hypothetical protein VMV46_05040 [Thermoanaerobaculia bacterium]|nr:hypothetical protein [Thermoanaerobaculia bacterium]